LGLTGERRNDYIREVDGMSEDCKRCHQTMLIRDGEEPTEICDHCAHEMLYEIADVVLKHGCWRKLGA